MSELQYDECVTNIKVIGVGGGGCNAVNQMVEYGVQNVTFYVANTDKAVLNVSKCENRIQLGDNGLGAGGNPEVGKKCAQETEQELAKALEGANMVFIAAGMGGGTGTGAAPVIAKIAKDQGALVVAVVTKPFMFEGRKRVKQADEGLVELRKYIDSMIVVSNDRLLEILGRVPFIEAFREADNVLRQGVQTITDLIGVTSLINLDFKDIQSVMGEQGLALIGIGMSKSENKAIDAAEMAISSPLLEADIRGAKNAIINVTGGPSMTLYDAQDAVNTIVTAAGNDVDIIFGSAINERLGDEIIVTIIATGFPEDALDNKNKSVNKAAFQTNVAPQTVKPAQPVSYAQPAPQPVPQPVVAQPRETVSDDTEELPSFFKNRK